MHIPIGLQYSVLFGIFIIPFLFCICNIFCKKIPADLRRGNIFHLLFLILNESVSAVVAFIDYADFFGVVISEYEEFVS